LILLTDYLGNRGIEQVPKALLALPIGYEDTRLRSHDPGMVLAVRDAKGKFQGIAVTWLNGDLTDKREGDDEPRQSYGLIKSNFIPLSNIDWDNPPETLLIGEGVETVLTGMQVTDLPGVATAGSGMMPYVEPLQCAKYIILADNGEAGQKSARHLARNLLDQFPDCSVQIATPDKPQDGKNGYDWNDALVDGVDPAHLREAILSSATFSVEDDREDDHDYEARVEELSKLDAIDYERQRKQVAKVLGVRTPTLDRDVARCRELRKNTDLYPHWTVEPWPEPVDTAELLQAIEKQITRYVATLGKRAIVPALWVMSTYVYEVAAHSPLLLVTSPEPDSGKTTLLGVLGFLARRTLSSVSISGPALFRSLVKWQPTFIIDEADTALVNNADLKEVVNSGWTRNMGVLRCDPDTHEPRRYDTFAPKAIGMKGKKLPDTTLSRSITIEMKRKQPDEVVEDFDHQDNETFGTLRRKLARWAPDHAEALRKLKPEIPQGFRNRTRMNWWLLLAIAELAGDEAAERAQGRKDHRGPQQQGHESSVTRDPAVGRPAGDLRYNGRGQDAVAGDRPQIDR
jgi:hypothetical protein